MGTVYKAIKEEMMAHSEQVDRAGQLFNRAGVLQFYSLQSIIRHTIINGGITVVLQVKKPLTQLLQSIIR